VITSRRKGHWTIPKGTKEPHLSPQGSAAKEALEEAGIKGEVAEHPLGKFQYGKWDRICTVEVYLMAVKKMLKVWDEDNRSREWVSLDEAVARLHHRGLKRILRSLPEFLEEQPVVFDKIRASG
jgi:phosphohistidine phosphatase